jgi:CSLREA domain-containing protein
LSSRGFRRARERSAAAERRRRQLRLRRAGLAAGATVGAFALAPAAAQAANFEVNTLADAPANGCTTGPGGCTLRDAMTDASANSESDLITFASGLTGTVRLTQGELSTSTTADDDVTVQGPGASSITISGDADGSGTPNSGDSRTFNIPYVDDSDAPASTSLTISGLTLAHGYSTGEGGAAYLGEDNHLSLRDVAVTGNTGSGGAIAGDKYSEISIANSTISGNSAARGGAVYTSGRLTIQNSTLSGNHATGGAYGGGGALNFGQKYGGLTITDSTISGNTATGRGGGIVSYADIGPKYQATQNQITNTTISDNTSDATGGGLYSQGLASDSGSFTIDHSTISNNKAGAGAQGGGIEIGNTINGAFQTVDSTISGNSANIGAGVAISTNNTPQVGPDGAISFDNSTIASNTAATDGGGMYLGIYGPTGGGPYTYSGTIGLNSTIVGNNTAGGASSDLDHADVATTGGFALAFSLVQAPGDGVVSQANSILNTDPQLGALGGNGGPTQTQLPSATSPVLDAGNNPLALGTDQRGDPRTVDLSAANAADATDIGAVEVPPPTPPAPAKKAKCKKKHKKKHKRSAESSKKHKKHKHKKCKKKHKKKRH